MQNQDKATVRKIAILILAHFEAEGIGNTVMPALEDITQASALFVITANCTDATADYAREAGARVFVRDTGNTDGKERRWLGS